MEENIEVKEEVVEAASIEEDEKTKKKKEKRKKLKEKIKKEKSSFFADFKKFITKGNIIDLAVAVVIGTAFNAIVTQLVDSIIMPLVSLATGGKSVEDWKWVITPATETTAEVALAYGAFIQAIIDFLIIALTIFIVLRILVNSQRGLQNWSKKMKKQKKGEVEVATEAAPAPEPVKIESQEDILKDIRTLLTKMSEPGEQVQLASEETPQVEKSASK